MSKTQWIGVDLSKETFHMALAGPKDAPSDWAKLAHAEFANTAAGVKACLAWLSKHEITMEKVAGVCAEATGRIAWDFILLLDGRLGCVSIVNPARPVAYRKSLGIRDKTDRSDACILALYGVNHRPTPRPLPSNMERELRELSNLRDVLQSQLQAHQNRLQERIISACVRKTIRQQVRTLSREIRCLETQMDRILEQDPVRKADAKHLRSIPGVGPKTTRVILAHFGDLRNYRRNELVALAGLYPRKYESGTSVRRKSKLVKGGGARVRAALYMAALSAKRYCPHLHQQAEHLRKRGFEKMAVIGVMMRKLLVLMRALVISGQDYYAEDPDMLSSNSA